MKITQLINNLLAWAISQDTTVATKMETFLLLPLVDEIIYLYHEVASTKMADIEINIPENLTIYGNKNGLAVIIRNLIDNALKHTSSTQIKIAASKMVNQVIFKITNNAFIASPEIVEKIQQQLKGTKMDGIKTAAGLGLKLVTYFAKQHHASIEMKSNVDEGTSFLITIPQ
jgi:signal transduction histidine kinase